MFQEIRSHRLEPPLSSRPAQKNAPLNILLISIECGSHRRVLFQFLRHLLYCWTVNTSHHFAIVPSGRMFGDVVLWASLARTSLARYLLPVTCPRALEPHGLSFALVLVFGCKFTESYFSSAQSLQPRKTWSLSTNPRCVDSCLCRENLFDIFLSRFSIHKFGKRSSSPCTASIYCQLTTSYPCYNTRVTLTECH